MIPHDRPPGDWNPSWAEIILAISCLILIAWVYSATS